MSEEAGNLLHRRAFEEAIELAEEGWGYASDYFRDKWECERQFKELRAILEDWHRDEP